MKINRTYEIKKQIEKVSAPELKNPELSMAKLIDTVNLKFPEIKLEISEKKKEGQEVVFSFSAKGDSSFQKFIDVVSFFQQQIYPVCFIKSVSLKAKENTMEYQIKGEFRVISDELQI